MVHARWPGWTDAGTLLLPVDARAWPPPSTPIELDGLVLRPKRELHVTLVGTALGKRLAEAGRTGALAGDAVRSAFESLDWSWRPTGTGALLRAEPERAGAPPRHAVIAHLDLPAMARFHARLGDRLGTVLPVPPPHVTLYVAGSRRGIGLPDPATLARRRVRALGPDDLPFTPPG